MTVKKYNWGDDTDAAVDITHLGGHDIDTNVGVAGDGTLRVTVATDDAVPVSLAAIEASLNVVDDWDLNDRCKVSLIAGQDGVAAGSGASDALTQRMILATNDPAVTALQIMDDWDESDRCKVNMNFNAGQSVSLNTGTTDAGTLRVTLATDGPIGSCTNTDDSAIGTKGLSIIAKAKTSQRAAVADVDAVQIVANEYGELVLSGHTWATRSTRVEEVNPLTAAYLIETVANETDKAAGTYHYYILMNGYKRMGLQFDLASFSGTDDTIQIYGSMLDTVAGSGVYHDITSQLTGGAATIVASGVIMDDSGITSLFKYLRVTVVITGGGAEDYVITCKKCW